MKNSHLKKIKIEAFVIGSAIPQIQTIVGLIAAVAIMQFTYTFPPLLRLGYDVITDAMAADAPYVPGQGARGRVDTWSQWSRWKRVSSAALPLNHSNLLTCFLIKRACSVVACSSNFSISFYSLGVLSWLAWVSYFHHARFLT